MSDKDLIIKLQSELERLRAELEKAREQSRELEASQQATLMMLEDLNEAAAKIEASKKEWESTFDAISDPLFIHDKGFKIIRCNKAYAEAAGTTFSHFIGKPYYEVFPKMDGPFKMCKKALELQEEEEEEEEEEFSCPVTKRIFKVRFYPIKDIDNKLLYSIHILEDITEAKKAADKIKQEMEITAHLLMIADAVAHVTDIDKVLEQTVHCGHEIIKCDYCLSYLWDKETKKFTPCKEYWLSHDLIPVFMIEPLDKDSEFVKEALGKGEPVVISDRCFGVSPRRNRNISVRGLTEISNKGEEKIFSWLPDIKTIAAIPLISRKEPLGLIIGIYKTAKEFTERDRKIMQGISHQVSTALEQARLYRESTDKSMELSHRIQTIQVMHEIDRSILSTLESQEILETVTRLVSKVISCDSATVGLVDKERQGFIYKAGFGVTFVPKGAFVPFEDTNAADVMKTNRPQYISNLNDIKDLPSIEKRLLQDGFLSHIMVPLIIKEDIAGVLSIGSKRAAAFTKEDLATLEKIASQIGVALSNASLVSDLKAMFIGIVTSLSSAIDAKSEWTAGHSQRVTEIAVEIGMAMGLNKETLEKLEIAGLLHDVGKIGTYEAILDKPGKLNEEEIKMIKQHPSKGAEILLPMKQFEDIIPAVKHHHEFYDGTGYPDGLKGEEIPLLARILTVADTIDAMGADRPYRKGKLMDAITMELKRCKGAQFDPQIVDVFLKTIK